MVVESKAEVGAAGEFDCCGHAAVENMLETKVDQSPGKSGGCHAMAPSCAAEKGAGALANGLGAAARRLMKGSVQSLG